VLKLPLVVEAQSQLRSLKSDIEFSASPFPVRIIDAVSNIEGYETPRSIGKHGPEIPGEFRSRSDAKACGVTSYFQRQLLG